MCKGVKDKTYLKIQMIFQTIYEIINYIERKFPHLKNI